MMIASIPRLVEVLRENRLLQPGQLEELGGIQDQFPETGALAQELIQRGWLSAHQAEQLLIGRGQDLVVGQYVLLEPLGEGNMGQVFKARHLETGELVALKVIRQEKRTDSRVLRRFRREVQAITLLSHPNIVTASSATEVGNTHFLAMEYCEGVNLDKIISQVGALPIAPACDYVRQAALGLQHAHEQGLIHRDIKPGNFLIVPPAATGLEAPEPGPRKPKVTQGKRKKGAPQDFFGRWGTLKILDLGFVLLQQTMPSEGQVPLTKKGYALGSVDYVAPEQVMNPHEVDIRADLYSLGCSFYEMLTGQVPFPEGSPVRRLYLHQSAEPEPVEKLRSDLPKDVVAVVHKLLAKDPGQRHQQPSELADELARILTRMETKSIPWNWQPPFAPGTAAPPAPPPPEDEEATGRFSLIVQSLVIAGLLFAASLLLYKFILK